MDLPLVAFPLLPEEIAVIGQGFRGIAMRFRVPAKDLGATGISIAVAAKEFGALAQSSAVPAIVLGGSANELWPSATGFRVPPQAFRAFPPEIGAWLQDIGASPQGFRAFPQQIGASPQPIGVLT